MDELTAPWTTLLLVCSGCRGSARGPSARAIRRAVKHAHGKDALRVLDVDCLKLCPDDALAVCLVDAAGARCLAVQTDRDADELVGAIAARRSRSA